MLQTSIIYCGDNLIKLKELPNDSIDVVYIDPPFNSNRHYELFWGDKQEKIAFEDRFGDPLNYIDWMRPRLQQIWRVLKSSGSCFFHCDWHACHYSKVLLDQIFGYNNFRNEIIWCYNRPGNSRMKNFIRSHDTIFYYVKTKAAPFYADPVRLPYSKSSKSREGYVKQGLSGAFKEKICKLNPKGKFPPDWWIDIPPLRPNAKERIGYPTQKPVNLIKRILLCSTQEGDVVLDAFCGCGTTLVASHHLKRRWLGIDISPTACRVMAYRLRKHLGLVEGQSFFVRDLPKIEQELKQMHPIDFQNWAVTALGGISSGKGSDKGIDGKIYLVESKHDLLSNINSFYPIQVKQREKVGRPDVDAFETAMRREKKNEGYVVAFSFSKESVKEAKRAYKEDGLNIHLITVQDLIKQAEDRLIEQ
jgi:DNA modification methylase